MSAGLGLVEGVLRLIPTARVGHVGMARDEESLEPMEYYFKVPSVPDARRFIVLDPMLATGGSAVATIEGHTDSTGPEEYNQGLSERRANAIAAYLTDNKGVSANRLKTVGYGESRPVADNATREGRQRNRRVIAVIIESK